MRILLTTLFMAGGLLLSGCQEQETDVEVYDVSNHIKTKLESIRPGIPIDTVAESQVNSLYQITLQSGDTIFANESADYFLVGELFKVEGEQLVNLTEQERQSRRIAALEKVPDNEYVTFAPEEVKATVTVFTDVDCGYCRKLHQEMQELNKFGVAVRYLAFPRAGVGSPSYQKMVSAWCADDRNTALTAIKQGAPIPPKQCDNPVSRHLALGGEFGVTGTPSLVLEDGRLVPGYMPAARLAAALGIDLPSEAADVTAIPH